MVNDSEGRREFIPMTEEVEKPRVVNPVRKPIIRIEMMCNEIMENPR